MKRITSIRVMLLSFLIMAMGSISYARPPVVEMRDSEDLRIYHVITREIPQVAIDRILSIPGTISDTDSRMGVKFDPEEYRIRVVKGHAFSWDDIEPRVLEIIEPYNIEVIGVVSVSFSFDEKPAELVIDKASYTFDYGEINGPISLLSDSNFRTWLKDFCKDQEVAFIYIGGGHMCIGLNPYAYVEVGDFTWNPRDRY